MRFPDGQSWAALLGLGLFGQVLGWVLIGACDAACCPRRWSACCCCCSRRLSFVLDVILFARPDQRPGLDWPGALPVWHLYRLGAIADSGGCEERMNIDLGPPTCAMCRISPQPGIMFKDITPLLAPRPARWTRASPPWPSHSAGKRIDAVCAIESRGFIFGAALARDLGAGFVPIRKPRKLPAQCVGIDYALEYGSGPSWKCHVDALAAGAHVLLVDDVRRHRGNSAGVARLDRACSARSSSRQRW